MSHVETGAPSRTIKDRVRRLYEANTGFRMAMIAFDLATVAFFLVTTFMPMEDWIRWADYAIGTVLLADFSARFWAARSRRRFLFSIWAVVDVVVILTMFAPLVAGGYGFLRIMRAMRLLRAYVLIRDARFRSQWFAHHGEQMVAAANLLVFVFLVSAFVYVDQLGQNPAIKTYVDAVYFTVTTLTTTGFGDITLVGTQGRLLSILVMIVGVGLFVKFAQAIFRPSKAHVTCPDCGLTRHEFDAVHCKHCGHVIRIPNEGYGAD